MEFLKRLWALLRREPQVKAMIAELEAKRDELVQGANRLRELAQEAEANSLTAKEAAIVDAIKNLLKEKVKVNCTGCGYCMPCPAGTGRSPEEEES